MLRHRKLYNCIQSTVKHFKLRTYILGIETSCDDTGAAVVDLEGNLISEYVNSQIKISSNIGGIIPMVARQLHLHHIDPTVQKVLNNINLSFKDLSAIALTVKPGLPLSLAIGRNYAVAKAKEYSLPIIPIHHMEAHALTVRMIDKNVGFPFMVLLISGGNSILGLAHDVENFSMLGTRCDMSPGDCLDKIARLLNLIGLSGSHTDVSGGRAIEILANENVDELIDFDCGRGKYRDCDFTFTGLEGAIYSLLRKNAKNGGQINMPQICASVLHNMALQMCKKVKRAMLYCYRNIDCPPKILVVSGGVASNLFFRKCLERTCEEFEYRLICPPVKYCTDNGAMIAWNGYELYQLNQRIVHDVDKIDFYGRAPFGIDLRQDVADKNIILSRLKLKDLFIK